MNVPVGLVPLPTAGVLGTGRVNVGMTGRTATHWPMTDHLNNSVIRLEYSLYRSVCAIESMAYGVNRNIENVS